MINYIQSLRLENVGFPKPEFQFGQKWYSKASSETFVFVCFDTKEQPVFVDQNYNTREIDTIDELIYAPSLPEILTFFRDKFSMQDLFVSVFQGDQTAEIENKVSQFILSTFHYSVS
jgi:hypothetical protein